MTAGAYSGNPLFLKLMYAYRLPSESHPPFVSHLAPSLSVDELSRQFLPLSTTSFHHSLGNRRIRVQDIALIPSQGEQRHFLRTIAPSPAIDKSTLAQTALQDPCNIGTKYSAKGTNVRLLLAFAARNRTLACAKPRTTVVRSRRACGI
jgi:hypothetical protein